MKPELIGFVKKPVQNFFVILANKQDLYKKPDKQKLFLPLAVHTEDHGGAERRNDQQSSFGQNHDIVISWINLKYQNSLYKLYNYLVGRSRGDTRCRGDQGGRSVRLKDFSFYFFYILTRFNIGVTQRNIWEAESDKAVRKGRYFGRDHRL